MKTKGAVNQKIGKRGIGELGMKLKYMWMCRKGNQENLFAMRIWQWVEKSIDNEATSYPRVRVKKAWKRRCRGDLKSIRWFKQHIIPRKVQLPFNLIIRVYKYAIIRQSIFIRKYKECKLLYNIYGSKDGHLESLNFKNIKIV